jgi:hypothetical protein
MPVAVANDWRWSWDLMQREGKRELGRERSRATMGRKEMG